MAEDWSSTLRKRHHQQGRDTNDILGGLDEPIRDGDEILSTYEIAKKVNAQRLQRLNTPYPVKELSEGLDNICFFRGDHPDYEAWFNKMTHPSRNAIPLGCTKNAFYQLRPDPLGLLPDDRDKENRMSQYNIQPYCFLGVNMNVPPAQQISPPGGAVRGDCAVRVLGARLPMDGWSRNDWSSVLSWAVLGMGQSQPEWQKVVSMECAESDVGISRLASWGFAHITWSICNRG